MDTITEVISWFSSIDIDGMSKALELKPNWPLYLCNRGKTYMILKKWDEELFLIRLWTILMTCTTSLRPWMSEMVSLKPTWILSRERWTVTVKIASKKAA